MASSLELQAMRRAIALSAHGLGSTSPNPPVGCVILDSTGQPIGEGYHARKGEAHAEGNALLAAGPAAKGGTAVVTLEPCNHAGHAPACRRLLIDAGIARVVIALTDPTSRGEGGVKELRKAGVSVETDVLAGEAMLVLGPWRAALALSRPVLTWVYAETSEGRTGALKNVPPARDLLLTADAVLDADGRLDEATPRSHGSGMIRLPADPLLLEHRELLRTLHSGGVRHLLLDGGADLVATFLADDLVDHVVAYLPDPGPSSQPRLTGQELMVPDGFWLTGVSRIPRYVKVSAIRMDRMGQVRSTPFA
ncbi:bifunctional diaminohydroxyphosphoribosylaminopyrimidine deaminase/5-amino-6-(5-phosphoribosylamino)uracil reductase [Nonomuraea sp. NEAU-A123]|uniref:bifunctional diaminohydroxyphosphoribosylaminopyrimidine deaminase/5-amino-6-(5-phosphoribosylamino)uracil reductase n=1 Tax=Nonomuraea sp. NEAU-A123 TaxID=2839649 RepID=UPI001BE49FA0|nr:bifunctional diaminohydroxyphosphoribosylaminopyrimidine deaminase/5-amino-6-(5-phosphoribosylamino)uracil reductase [Nonomuraea sp. NEAU-A123]MBT2234441.1 bifunctional diaminohydroxyphosphoribosylaminopyrimidine deaminase/5-amino-6-(5-phosphoribosylamino)uracil reductase RibD [Nonomuraea sp. NEAU-A123]